jgi:hypothetical protein
MIWAFWDVTLFHLARSSSALKDHCAISFILLGLIYSDRTTCPRHTSTSQKIWILSNRCESVTSCVQNCCYVESEPQRKAVCETVCCSELSAVLCVCVCNCKDSIAELNVVEPVSGCGCQLIVRWPSSDEETQRYYDVWRCCRLLELSCVNKCGSEINYA